MQLNSELKANSVRGSAFNIGSKDVVADGTLTGTDINSGSLTSDDIGVAAGRVIDAGSDLAPGECSGNTVGAGSANISNDVVAVTLDSATSGNMPTTVRQREHRFVPRHDLQQHRDHPGAP